MDRALIFYKDVMGFRVEHQTDEWSELKLNEEISLALQRVSEPGAGIGFIVDSCEEATTELEARGAEIIKRCDKREADKVILTQFKDVDGHVLWITEIMK